MQHVATWSKTPIWTTSWAVGQNFIFAPLSLRQQIDRQPRQVPRVPWGWSVICLCPALFCATPTFYATQVLQQMISCFVQALNQLWAGWHQDKLETFPVTCRSAALPKGTFCTLRTREQQPQSCAVLSPLPAGPFLLLFGSLLIFCQITLSDYKYISSFSFFFPLFWLDNYPGEL